MRVENAELADATNPEGASRRITALLSGASSLYSGRSGALGGAASTLNDVTLVGSPAYSPRLDWYGGGGGLGGTGNEHGTGAVAVEYELSELDKHDGRVRQGMAHEFRGARAGVARGRENMVQPAVMPPPRVYGDSESEYESMRRSERRRVG
mgnify:CR=1 FL=1